MIAARNLPEMKKLHHTADAYVEITLVSEHHSSSQSQFDNLDLDSGRDPGSDFPRTSVQVKYSTEYTTHPLDSMLFCKMSAECFWC